MTDRRSFDCAQRWRDQVREFAPADTELVLVGNKADLAAEREVTAEEGRLTAEAWGVGFWEASALDGTHVEELFGGLVEKIVGKLEAMRPEAQRLRDCIEEAKLGDGETKRRRLCC